MHSEFYTLSEEAAATLREVKANGHRVIFVGTAQSGSRNHRNKFQNDIQETNSGWTNDLSKPGCSGKWRLFNQNFPFHQL